MPYFGVPSMTNKTNGREFFQDKVFTDIDASDGYPRTCKVRTLCGWGEIPVSLVLWYYGETSFCGLSAPRCCVHMNMWVLVHTQ